MNSGISELRVDFEAQAGRSLALPIAGTLGWSAAGLSALFLNEWTATIVLIISTGILFPLALVLAPLLGERIITNTNPLSRLMVLCTLMVNLLWAVHISVMIYDREFLPLTLGISLGLHWVVFSWIVAHPVGIIHAISRTILVTVLWWSFPDHRVTAVAIGVVISYLISIYALSSRTPSPGNNKDGK